MQNLCVDEAFAVALRQHQSGNLAEAERGYRAILAWQPEHADSLHLLGVIALQTGNPEPALELISRAIALRPDGAVYRNNLGQVLERLGRLDDAGRAYEAAIALDPEYPEAFNNLGHVLERRGSLAEAAAHYRKAIALDAGYAEPHTNLGNVLKDTGELDAAIAAYRRAVELRPAQSMLHSNLLLALHYHAASTPEALAREHLAWAERHVAPLATERRPHANVVDSGRRLRVGYVSPDFRVHPVARFLLPLLRQHDRRSFELFGYSDVSRPDEVTTSLRAEFDCWREVDTLGDAELAAAIRADRIDILVDLAAHSGRNRLLVFARKPAPVQVTYLAYCSTTGVDAIDYRLSDRFLDPPDRDTSCYTERTIRLPDCYWCYTVPALPDAEVPSSERAAGPPTFGCLNNFAKVTDTTLAVWAELLEAVPDARLLLYARAEIQRDRVRRSLEQAGVAAERVSFVGWQPLAGYLETYRSIDVALDPIPYGGGTTSCDALWMGVPVVTLAGATAVSRAGASLLSNVGLEELIATTRRQYVDIAAGLLRDRDELRKLRGELRGRLERSPLMDANRFAGNLEGAFRAMWRRWCEAQA